MSTSHFSPDEIIESAYVEVILPQFDIEQGQIQWNGHSVIGSDSTEHFFFLNKEEYLLVYEDYPLHTEQEIAETIRPNQKLIPIEPKDLDAYDNILTYDSDNPDLNKVGIVGSYRLYRITR